MRGHIISNWFNETIFQRNLKKNKKRNAEFSRREFFAREIANLGNKHLFRGKRKGKSKDAI